MQDNQRSKEELVARAEEANRLLGGTVFADAFEEAHRVFVAEWLASGTTPDRELCWAKVAGLAEVKRQLRRIIGHGEHASRQPDER